MYQWFIIGTWKLLSESTMSNDLNMVATLKLMWLLIHLHVSSSQGKTLWSVLAKNNQHGIQTI